MSLSLGFSQCKDLLIFLLSMRLVIAILERLSSSFSDLLEYFTILAFILILVLITFAIFAIFEWFFTLLSDSLENRTVLAALGVLFFLLMRGIITIGKLLSLSIFDSFDNVAVSTNLLDLFPVLLCSLRLLFC